MERKPVKLKRFFLLIVGWLVVTAAAIGGSILYSAYEGSQYEATAVPYVKEVVPKISEWDAEKLRVLMAPEMVATLSESNIAKAMELFSTLGTLESMEEPKYKEVVELPGEGETGRTLVTYTLSTQFTNGPAEFRVQLVDRGDRLQLYNFNLSSEVLSGPAK